MRWMHAVRALDRLSARPLRAVTPRPAPDGLLNGPLATGRPSLTKSCASLRALGAAADAHVGEPGQRVPERPLADPEAPAAQGRKGAS